MKNLITRTVFIAACLFGLTACFEPTGTLRIKTDLDSADLYINNELETKVGKDYMELTVTAGTRELRISQLSEDGEWKQEGTATVVIPEDGLIEKYISTRSTPTEKRIARLALEKKKAEAERIAKRVEEAVKTGSLEVK